MPGHSITDSTVSHHPIRYPLPRLVLNHKSFLDNSSTSSPLYHCNSPVIMLFTPSSFRSFAVLTLSTCLLSLHPYDNFASAAPTLETRQTPIWSGNGKLMVHQDGAVNGCITANAQWTTSSGQCAVFSATPLAPGTTPFHLTSSAGPCGIDLSQTLVCTAGNPRGPENWHVSSSIFPVVDPSVLNSF